MRQELDHLIHFAHEHNLFDAESSVLISVSGGLDSMVLLGLMTALRNRGEVAEVRAIHFNHGTRIENSDEEKLVRDYCKALKVPFLLRKLQIESGANFEKRARDLRYEKLDEALLLGEFLLLAHHIDDSFEWSLMEQMRAGAIKASLGVPVINGKIRRPLMAFSKNQLRAIAIKQFIPYLNDPTNRENGHDRNYLRNEVIPDLAKRYPKYLRNYVFRSNQLARELKLHAGSRGPLNAHLLGNWGAVIYRRDFELDLSGAETLLTDAICSFSTSGRGVLQKQISKMIGGSLSGSKGPFTLSGGVKGYSYPGMIIICGPEGPDYLALLDKQMVKYLKKVKATQIPRVDLNQFSTSLYEAAKSKTEHLPFFAFCLDQGAKSIIKDSLKWDSRFPLLSEYCKEQGIYFRPILNFISYWKKGGAKRKGSFFFAKI